MGRPLIVNLITSKPQGLEIAAVSCRGRPPCCRTHSRKCINSPSHLPCSSVARWSAPLSPSSFPPRPSQRRDELVRRLSARAQAPSDPIRLLPSPSHSRLLFTWRGRGRGGESEGHAVCRSVGSHLESFSKALRSTTRDLILPQ